MPVTNIKYVEGAESVVTSIEQGDGTIKVTTKVNGEVDTKEIEAGKVKSVNGKTGDVVVGEIVDASINGKVITLTFADGTTKTLTTQDSNTVPKRYITQTYRSGTQWYEVYNDGWVRQGGFIEKDGTSNVTFLKPFADLNYTVYGAFNSSSNGSSFTLRSFSIGAENKISSTTTLLINATGHGSKFWVAEGQGA